MPFFFCISVRFLDTAFHGRKDSGELEWPPSPLRLFQALVAAAAARGKESQRLPCACIPAFEFLQALDAPIIVAPAGHAGTPFRVAVPNNDLDLVAKAWSQRKEPKKGPAELKAMKTICPRRLCGGDTIHYLWKLSDAARSECATHQDVLFAAARDVVAFGWGIDMAIGHAQLLTKEEADTLRGERWCPVAGASLNQLRVPQPGTITALMARYEAFLNRLPTSGGFVPVPPLSAFRVVGYRRATDPPPRRWVAVRLRHPVEERAAVFSQTRANCVAAMTRCATGRVAIQQGRPGEWIDRYVHGHRRSEEEASSPRFSYLPLPSIERRGRGSHVLGAIRRVLVAELVEAAESHLDWVRQMLPGQFLTDDKTGDRRAMLAPLAGGDWVLRQYAGPAQTWATATPVVLPGSDEGKFAKTEKLFFKALGHAGYSPEALADWEFRNVSFWPGGDLALRFQRPDYLQKGCWSVYHVRLRWKQEVQGPLALGAGRHCGLGIFAAVAS